MTVRFASDFLRTTEHWRKLMYSLPHSILELARRRHGLVTVAELTRAGVSKRHRLRLIEHGALATMHRGVYRFAATPLSWEARCVAALLAAPDAALSGPTAGRWIGLRKVHTSEVHLLAARAVHLDGVTCHRSSFLAESDIALVRGARTLKPARLFCDLAWHLSEEDLESVLEQMLDRRLVMMGTIRAIARRFLAAGRPGTVRLSRVLDSRSDWVRPAESDLEMRVARHLATRGIDTERQFRVRLDDDSIIRLDLAVPSVKVAIEVDHVTWHGGRLDAQRDKRRDRALALRGWVVVRLTDTEIQTNLDGAGADVARVVKQRQSAA